METISMIKQNNVFSCALHMHVHADFMHFVLFVKLYQICPCMNRHFGNMYSHSGSRFTAKGPSWFTVEWYFECQCMTVELSGSVILCHNRRYFSHCLGICDGTYDMLVYIKFDLRDRSGSHALRHIDISFWFVQAPCPTLRGQLFRS